MVQGDSYVMDPLWYKNKSFFDFYVTLWGIISPNKLILVKIRLEKVDLGEVYIQKEQENFKNALVLTLKGVHYNYI